MKFFHKVVLKIKKSVSLHIKEHLYNFSQRVLNALKTPLDVFNLEPCGTLVGIFALIKGYLLVIFKP